MFDLYTHFIDFYVQNPVKKIQKRNSFEQKMFEDMT